MSRLRGQTYMSSLHSFFAVGSDISILIMTVWYQRALVFISRRLVL